MVGLGRFELPTSPLSGVRSNQLSYRPDATPSTSLVRIQEEADAQAALLPGFASFIEVKPGSELSRKVSRTQLNVHSSYAAIDHRC